MNIFDRTLMLLEKSLDLRAARHQVIAGNVANEETPGYRAKELKFLDALAAARQQKPEPTLTVTNARHLGTRGNSMQRVTGRVEEIPTPDLPMDSNSVNLDLEMAKLSDNAMHFNMATQITGFRFKQLLSAIKDTN